MQYARVQPGSSRFLVPPVALGDSGYGSGAASAGASAASFIANYASKGGEVRGYTTGQAAGQVGAAAAQGFATGGPIGAGIAAGIKGLQLLFSRKGPKQKVATTKIDQQVGPLLQQNLDDYLNGPRTQSEQTAALQAFDAGFEWLTENCLIPEMGAPGEACVKDRGRDGCHWHATPGHWEKDPAGGKSKWVPAGPEGSSKTDCWNWYIGMRDPIASDPDVESDAAYAARTSPISGAENAISSVLEGGGGIGYLLLAGGLLVVAMSMGSEK